MATQQMIRPETQSKSWEAIFPGEQLTEQKSALFVKKLLAVAISSVTYLRAIFPEHAYGDKCLEDLNLKILKDESSCPGACQVIKWVKGCFDALDKKYLKMLVIGLYLDPDDPETVIETYTFKFSYNNDGKIEIYRNDSKLSSAQSVEETKKATIRMLRTIVILTSNLDSLPENAMMTMKLFYYDDITPTDYEPPGFQATNPDDMVFAEDTTNIAIGEVSTNFHGLKMRVKTSSKQFEYEQGGGAALDKEGKKISNTGLDSETLSQSLVESSSLKEADSAGNHMANNRDCVASPDKAPSKPDSEYQVRCPCGCHEDDGLMILCSHCNLWQHGICFLITEEKKAPTEHICDICSKLPEVTVPPTDPHLMDMSSIAVQATCLWRRTLTACQEFKRILAPQLSRRLSVEVTVAQGLINRLEKEGFVVAKTKGKRMGKMVDHSKIQTDGIPQYLKTPLALSKKLSTLQALPTLDVTESSVAESVPDHEQMVVDHLVEKTTRIDLQDQSVVVDHLVEKTTRIDLQDQSVANEMKSPRRGNRKRAISKVDNTEFEISNSQESGRARSKRKKASVSKRNLHI